MTPEEVDERSRRRARTNRHRLYVVGAFVVLAFLALSFNLQRQQTMLSHVVEQQSQTVRAMCLQRQANVLKANSNWDALTAIESHNRFIDNDLRNERLAVFANAKLIVPDCNF